MSNYYRLKGVLFVLPIAVVLQLLGCNDNLKSLPVTPTDVKLSPEQEFEGLSKEANLGNIDAQLNLGLKYAKGEGVAEDPGKAMEWFEKAAIAGNASAQYRVGQALLYGNDIAKDVSKAIEWLQKAANQNYGDAQFSLGIMYRLGTEIPKDEVKSNALLESAATNGSEMAVLVLGDLYERDDVVKAVKFYRLHAERGEAIAQRLLGHMYARGAGVSLSEQTAFQWYLKSAQQGNSSAQFNVGVIYSEGTLVPKDLTIAAEWFKKSAAQGNPDAQQNLGLVYANGQGLPLDLVLAYAWSNLAASGPIGKPDAARNRSIVEPLLSKDELMEAQRLSSKWKYGQLLARDGQGAGANTEKASVSGTLVKTGSGTLFIVNKTGFAITNQHVVQSCGELRLAGREGVAKKISEDVVNDIALLQISGDVKAAASLADNPSKLRQGDDVLVFGYPLNTVLSSGGNLTPGLVSATTGLGNNTNQIQITAPIQPGSSGSPVMNRKGEVVGVVSMKLDDKKMVSATGQVGQNVNFAVNGQTLRAFLDANKVNYSSGSMFAFEKNPADIADEAKKWTLVVECWK